MLEGMGFALAGMANDGTAHRYRRNGRNGGRLVTIDVLAPDGVGERADLTTTPPGHSIQVPAGTQALRRTERVTIKVGTRTGEVPRGDDSHRPGPLSGDLGETGSELRVVRVRASYPSLLPDGPAAMGTTSDMDWPDRRMDRWVGPSPSPPRVTASRASF